jgi:PTS system nitrogen regulatory IIA component
MTNIAKILPLANVLLDLEISSKNVHSSKQDCYLKTIAASPVPPFPIICLHANAGFHRTGSRRGYSAWTYQGSEGSDCSIIRLKDGIPFESPDGRFKLIFLLMPDNVTQQHLEILSKLPRCCPNESFRDELNAEASASVARKILRLASGRLRRFLTHHFVVV